MHLDVVAHGASVARLNGADEQNAEQHGHEGGDEVVKHGVPAQASGRLRRNGRHARYETVKERHKWLAARVAVWLGGHV